QSNYPPCTVPRPDDGRRLEAKTSKGGISRLAPSKLAPRLQSLPPILHMLPLTPMQSYSKGAQGLSVLPRVLGIFTESAVSLCLWSRQLGSRYAIRACRNLPEKKFRFLRTVIVTAAVYRGFGSPPRPYGLTGPLNLPAPGRRQTLYIALRLSRVLWFC